MLLDRAAIKERFGGDLFVILEDDAEVFDHYVGRVFVQDRGDREKGLLRIPLKVKEKNDGLDQG